MIKDILGQDWTEACEHRGCSIAQPYQPMRIVQLRASGLFVGHPNTLHWTYVDEVIGC